MYIIKNTSILQAASKQPLSIIIKTHVVLKQSILIGNCYSILREQYKVSHHFYICIYRGTGMICFQQYV